MRETVQIFFHTPTGEVAGDDVARVVAQEGRSHTGDRRDRDGRTTDGDVAKWWELEREFLGAAGQRSNVAFVAASRIREGFVEQV